MKYAFIASQPEGENVGLLCRQLGVREQGYYSWRTKPVCARKRTDNNLSAKIRVIHAESRRTYGSPRVFKELKAEGTAVSEKRVARLMRAEGLRAKAARKYRVTTDSGHAKAVPSNVLERKFEVAAPNTAWVGDITYLWTGEGWMYLAVFLDLYSRLVVGWSLGTRLDSSLVVTAFKRACMRRNPAPGLLVHTDQGVQYVSDAFTKLLATRGAVQSMSRRGNCWDNAVAESFFHSLKVEAIYGIRFETRTRLEYEVFDYIERFYNRVRRHSTSGYRSPLDFEKLMFVNNQKAAA